MIILSFKSRKWKIIMKQFCKHIWNDFSFCVKKIMAHRFSGNDKMCISLMALQKQKKTWNYLLTFSIHWVLILQKISFVAMCCSTTSIISDHRFLLLVKHTCDFIETLCRAKCIIQKTKSRTRFRNCIWLL